MIPVTKPFLPDFAEYENYLKGIWHRQWLTNMGPLASDLELKLKNYLKLNHLLFVTNGTIALQIAIKSLDLHGEIITTPFSFVATTSSIVWEGATPVFVDIDKETLNIDVSKIEAAINEKTCAILVTHVYGNPCEVYAIERIAKKYNLKVIYDGAHAFGVEIQGKSIFSFGDISTCSLHATKLYHSIEGGLIVTQDPDLLKRIAKIRNFGFSSSETFSELGINGKNSEFHAAMGLVNLKHIKEIFHKRRLIFERYKSNLDGLNLKYQVWQKNSENNYAYFPIIFENQEIMFKCIQELSAHEIFTRRYFYPSLANALPYLSMESMQITDDISSRILCLPLYTELTIEEVDLITRLIRRVLNN
jgi:dTDP-4-amino-4,6-dideoxygalactose transaminase